MKESALSRHYVALDGLRGVAALIVVIFHQSWWLGFNRGWHGFLAVDFFFVLSGFVIAHAYGHRLASGKMSFLTFAELRIIRLYPLIWLGAGLGTVAVLIEAAQAHRLGLGARGLLSFLPALLALPTPFLKHPFMPNGPVWSIFWEILANLAFAAFINKLSTRRLGFIVVVSGLAVVTTIFILRDINVGFEWRNIHLGAVRVTFPFAAGVLIHRLFQEGGLRWMPALPFWALAVVLAAVLVTPLSYNFLLEASYLVPAILLLMPAIVVSGAVSEITGPWLFVARFSGELSYPIYILHTPICSLLARSSYYTALPIPVRLAVVLIVIFVVSTLASRLYDRPLRGMLSFLAQRRLQSRLAC